MREVSGIARAVACGAMLVVCSASRAGEKFPWRGFMLDEARHFFGKAAVIECLDEMKRNDLNVFHWHLTDDQGWRLDLPSFPELVKFGSRRVASPPYGSDSGEDGVPYGPHFYTADDVHEVLVAARTRGIDVVPEIEMPGHIRALLAAHPEFACEPQAITSGAWTQFGVCKDVLCLGNDDAVEYCCRVLDEVTRIFPGTFIHIGGDECPTNRWASCGKCRARMMREGLGSLRELQAWFTGRMAWRLAANGRRAVVWDEALFSGSLPPGVVIQRWRSRSVDALAVVTNGHDVIMSPSRQTYFTLPEYRSDNSKYRWREWVMRDRHASLPNAKLRRFDPNEDVPEAYRARVLGGECCAWSEAIRDVGELRYKCLSRLPAFAEAIGRDRRTGEVRLFDESPEAKTRRLAWWTDARFGMFIHFGLYSLPARGEWIRTRERMSDAHYRRYFDRFDPDLLDMRDWARRARTAGMRYAVLTAKHHDGFCLFDSAHTDFKSPRTPCGRDLVREFVEAFRAEGLRIGLYYSLKDWNHPDFTVDGLHPRRPPDKGLQGVHADDAEYDRLNVRRDMARYRRYMKDQVRELLTNYGKIDILWLDYSYPSETERQGKGRDDWDSVGLLRLVRMLQPQVIVNDRLDLNTTVDGWDFLTTEARQVTAWPMRVGRRVPWETCHALAAFFGYHRDETGFKTPFQLIDLLVDTVSKGGNTLINVAPTGRGEFDGRTTTRLEALGRWMRANGAAIYGCTAAPESLVPPPFSRLTYDPAHRRLYLHLMTYPYRRLPVAFADRIRFARFLHDGSEISITKGALELPPTRPDVEVPVIACDLSSLP